MPLGVIFATIHDNIFARNGTLPWRNIGEDMAFFKQITLNTNIVMGRKTYESLPNGSLPSRKNYILTTKSCEEITPYSLVASTQNSVDSADPGRFVATKWPAVRSVGSPPNPETYFINYDEFHDLCSKEEPVWVIGGKEVISLVLEREKVDLVIWNKITIPSQSEGFTENNGDEISYCNPDLSFFPCYDKFRLSSRVEIGIYSYGISNSGFSTVEKKYLSIGVLLAKKEESRVTRNGKTRSLFDEDTSLTASFDNGFPVLQSKKVWWKGVQKEFDFFLSGETDTNILSKDGVKIWEGNTSASFLSSSGKSHFLKPGEMGPMYGFQLRHFGESYKGSHIQYNGLDQIEKLIETICRDPFSRRLLLTTYNPSQADEGVLYPCHGLITQFYVNNSSISLKTYQRSADWFLGVPFNLSSYALLLEYIVKRVNQTLGKEEYKSDKTTIMFGDVHLYEEHFTAFLEQYIYALLNHKKFIMPVKYDDNGKVLRNYKPLREIKATMIS